MTSLNQRWRTALRSNDLPRATRLLARHRLQLDLENRRGIDGEGDLSSLDLAARHGSPGLIRLLLDAGAHVAACSELKDTALHEAAGRARVEALRTLIAAGAPLNPTNHVGHTPLITAVRTGVIEAVRLLIEAGADVHVRDEAGQTALHHALGMADPSVAQALLDAGVDPWARDQRGNTALHVLCGNLMRPVLLSSLVARAWRENAAWDEPNGDGDRLLHVAVRNGHVLALQGLLALGLSPDHPNRDGVTALDLADALGEDAVGRVLRAEQVRHERKVLDDAVPDAPSTMVADPIRPPRRL